VQQNIEKAKSLLVEGGQVSVIDFGQNEELNLFQKWGINFLYLLFSPFTGVSRSSMPNYESFFRISGFILTQKSSYHKGLYQSFTFTKG
jgi:hypothetical protein